MKTSVSGVIAGYALDAGKQVPNRHVAIRGAESDLVGVIESESDGVAILQDTMIYLLSVDEDALAVTTVFKSVAIPLRDDRGTPAGDAAVGKLEMISGLTPAADEKGRLGDANKETRATRRRDFERYPVDERKIMHQDLPESGL